MSTKKMKRKNLKFGAGVYRLHAQVKSYELNAATKKPVLTARYKRFVVEQRKHQLRCVFEHNTTNVQRSRGRGRELRSYDYIYGISAGTTTRYNSGFRWDTLSNHVARNGMRLFLPCVQIKRDGDDLLRRTTSVRETEGAALCAAYARSRARLLFA